MFTIFFAATFVWFVTALVSSLWNCIVQRKLAIAELKRIIRTGTIRDLRNLCKGNPKFKGYSKHIRKAELQQFMLSAI